LLLLNKVLGKVITCEDPLTNKNTKFEYSDFKPMFTFCWREMKYCKKHSSYKMEAPISENEANRFFQRLTFKNQVSKKWKLDDTNEFKFDIERCGEFLCMGHEFLETDNAEE